METELYNKLKEEFENKGYNISFDNFISQFIIENTDDSEVLKILNKYNRDINNIASINYFENNSIKETAGKILIILKASKDFNNFKELSETVNKANNIEFDKVLNELLKTKKE